MSARRLALGRKRPRGAPRRLRALHRWAMAMGQVDAALFDFDGGFYNWKLPLLSSLVEGPHARDAWRVTAAQALLDACDGLYRARPSGSSIRITCVVCLPDLFSSEVCLYRDRVDLQSQAFPGPEWALPGRSLVDAWGLQRPTWMEEQGQRLTLPPMFDDEPPFVGERWWFGELR